MIMKILLYNTNIYITQDPKGWVQATVMVCVQVALKMCSTKYSAQKVHHKFVIKSLLHHVDHNI